jgi:cyclase
VHDFAYDCFVPFTVGGGIYEVEHIQRLLRAGADKISINSAAYTTPGLIEEAAKRFGAQCVVASVDARRFEDGGYRCFSHSGTVARDVEPVGWARELESRGAGEILLTSIDRDGTMQGYDLALIERVARAVNVPVIASGGGSTKLCAGRAGRRGIGRRRRQHFPFYTADAGRGQALPGCRWRGDQNQLRGGRSLNAWDRHTC